MLDDTLPPTEDDLPCVEEREAWLAHALGRLHPDVGLIRVMARSDPWEIATCAVSRALEMAAAIEPLLRYVRPRQDEMLAAGAPERLGPTTVDLPRVVEKVVRAMFGRAAHHRDVRVKRVVLRGGGGRVDVRGALGERLNLSTRRLAELRLASIHTTAERAAHRLACLAILGWFRRIAKQPEPDAR